MKRTSSVPLVAAALLSLSGLVGSATAFGGHTTLSSRAVVKVAFNKTLKKTIVVDGAGRTLYMFTEDTNGLPTCASADPTCPTLWPAFTSTGKPLAGKGINARLLGIVKGAGGKPQVTYNRHPLYYWHGGGQGYVGDTKPGDAKGQAFFSAWYVLSPKGTPIK
jgi:predicted lipoprotein with Yx(FWY)xxD motif